MRQTLYFIFILTGCLLCHAPRAFSKNTIKWEEDAPKVEIKANGLFFKTPAPKLNNSQAAPADTRARDLAVDNYRFQWHPRWNFIGLGGAIFPFALQSIDESTLGIVETLPQENAPSSSIIVFINLYNLRIINYLVMTGKDVRKFCYVPFSHKLVCLIKSPYDKYDPKPEFQLQTMDTHTGKVISSSPMFKKGITALCCSKDGSKLFVTFKNSNKVKIYDVDKLSEAFKTFKTIENPVTLNRSANGNRLVIAGSSKIEIFNIEQQVIPEKTIKLPDFFQPEKLVLCSNDASKFLISRLGEASYFYNGKSFIKLCDRSDADINWSLSEKRIILGTPHKSTICIYDPQKLKAPEMKFYFRKVKPKTNGKLYKLISLPGHGAGIGILDTRGAFLQLYRERRRWRKRVIIDQPTPQ
jgi:WD40 repeat protein